MAQTVWTWPEVQRWRGLLWKRPENESWTTYHPDTALPCVRSWFRQYHPVILPKQFEKTLLPSTDISKDVNDSYRSYSTYSGSVIAMLAPPDRGAFLFMTYKIGELQADEHITMDQMHTLHLPCRGDVKMEDGTTKYGETGEMQKFSILAIVKLRDNPNESDMIQLYDVFGTRVRPNHSQSKIRGYIDNAWKVEDLQAGMRVFLLYVRDHSGLTSQLARHEWISDDEPNEEVDAATQDIMSRASQANADFMSEFRARGTGC